MYVYIIQFRHMQREASSSSRAKRADVKNTHAYINAYTQNIYKFACIHTYVYTNTHIPI